MSVAINGKADWLEAIGDCKVINCLGCFSQGRSHADTNQKER